VICADSTSLTDKYNGQILTAIGKNGNNQIVTLAFAFVEGESFESRSWFFRKLKIYIVKDQPNFCILHNRHTCIMKAIKALQHPMEDEQMPWEDLQSRWCMRHLDMGISKL
jgi:hypothetical protein